MSAAIVILVIILAIGIAVAIYMIKDKEKEDSIVLTYPLQTVKNKQTESAITGYVYNTRTKNIIHTPSGYCLNILGGVDNEDAGVGLYKCSTDEFANDKWTYSTSAKTFKSKFGTNKCLDYSSSISTDPKTRIKTCDTNSATQKWNLSAANVLKYIKNIGKPSITKGYVYDPSTKYIIDDLEGTCLNIYGSTNTDGAKVGAYTCGTDPNDKWTYDESTKAFKTELTGNKCLAYDDNNNTILKTCDSTSNNQKWDLL